MVLIPSWYESKKVGHQPDGRTTLRNNIDFWVEQWRRPGQGVCQLWRHSNLLQDRFYGTISGSRAR